MIDDEPENLEDWDNEKLERWSKDKCGNCVDWLQSSCPQHREEKNYIVGPGIHHSICEQYVFSQSTRVIEMREELTMRKLKINL